MMMAGNEHDILGREQDVGVACTLQSTDSLNEQDFDELSVEEASISDSDETSLERLGLEEVTQKARHQLLEFSKVERDFKKKANKLQEMIKQLEIAKYNNGLQGLRPEYQIKTLHKHNQVKKLNAVGDSTRISAQPVSSHIPDMTDETSDEDERGSREESVNELIIKLLLVDREIRERGLEDFRPRCIFKESTHSDFYNISEE